MFAQSRARSFLCGAARLAVRLTSSPLTKPSLRSNPIKQRPSQKPSATTTRSQRPEKSGGTYCIFPSLHNDVAALLKADGLRFGFHDKDDPAGCIKEYDTSIMGRFVCRDRACSCKGWRSMNIAITIRMYPGDEYNARVYKQRCLRCQALGDLVLEHGSSYADRVAYRIKKWCGVEMELPTYKKKEGNGPHQSELCEGCKAGRCKEGVLHGSS